MRNLEECKAEVFRRSEQRIKDRVKKRRLFLACLAPCCFCFVVLSAIYMPMLMTAHNKSASSGERPEETQDISENDFRPSITIKIQDDETALYDSYGSKQTEAAHLRAMIEDVFESDKEQKKDLETDSKDLETLLGDSTLKDRLHKSAIKTITFTAPDGTETTYTLDGNKLIDEATKQEIMLSEEQCAELLKRLALLTNQEENTQ